MQKIIIDGYNVIYTDEGMRRTACKDPEGARKQLVDKLRDYLRDRQAQVTVVFDGRGLMAETESVIPGKLQLIYSPSPGTADDLIVEALEQSDNPREYIVVTSDMADIGRAARGLGAEVIGSKRFLQRLADSPAAPPDSMEKPQPQHGDTAYWLKKFSRRGRKPSKD